MNCEEKSIDCVAQDELDSGANGTSEGTAADQDNLFLWSWFIVFGIVLVGLTSNLIVIHAICFVKRFHRPQNFMLANLSITSVITLFVYTAVNLLERYPIIPFSPFVCGMLVTIFLSLLLVIPAGYMGIRYDPEKIGSHLKCSWSYSFLGSISAYTLVQCLQLAVVVVMPTLIMFLDLCRLAEKLKFLVTCQVNRTPTGFIASRERLLRNSLIFTMVFIILRIPVGIYGFLYRIPPGGLVSLSVLNAVRRWRKFWVFVHIVQIALIPLIVFVLSTEIRQYLRSCFELNILP